MCSTTGQESVGEDYFVTHRLQESTIVMFWPKTFTVNSKCGHNFKTTSMT